MSARTLTSTNSKLTFTIPGVLTVPLNVQGYATDDAFMFDSVQVAETMKGVDGKMSSGYLPAIYPQTITLMATSPSRDQFKLWYAAMKSQQEIIVAQGVLLIPSTREQILLINGVLHDTKQIPDGKKTLQPVQYVIHWEEIEPQPFVA